MPGRAPGRTAQALGPAVKVAYVVSRFPHVSETFIVRDELDAVASRPGIAVELLSLFPPVDDTVHDVARPWVARVRRPGPGAALRSSAWWAVRRPRALARAVAEVAAGHRRAPRTLVRALATVPIACAHARGLARAGVDHVHAHYATYPAQVAWVVGRLTGLPYSFTAHAHDLYVDRSLLETKVREAAFVVTISEFNRRYLEGTRTPVEVVHCGVDADVLAYAPRAPRRDGPVRALCVASLQEYKGHRVLLQALRDVERVEVDLVGSGALRAQLEAAAAPLGGRVRFHGALPEDRVRTLLAEADVFVLPSVVARDGQMEGIPVALMEAMACGVPVVTTRLSGIPELVRDGETGWLAEPADAASLAARLRELLAAPPEEVLRRVAAGRRLVEREFTLAEEGRRMAELFQPGAGRKTSSSSSSVPATGPKRSSR